MLQLIPEQISIKKDYAYWVVDLEENDLPSSPQELKDLLLNKYVEHLGLEFIIEGIEYFTYVKEKIVLQCREL